MKRISLREPQGIPIQSYVRRGAASPKEASILLFCVTKLIGELAGFADFIERALGEPEEMWKEHGQESVLNPKEHYDEFVKSNRQVSFIRFRNLHVASKPILPSNLCLFLGRKNLSEMVSK